MAKRRNMASIDRLGDLPDSILSHILSFLPTKTAVKTSILAKRWSSLWAHAPALHFDQQNQHVINRVMLQHQAPSLDSFRLILSLHDVKDSCEYQLETWIIAAIVRNVKKLHLDFHYKRILPRRVFTCETLVDLSLRGCAIPVNAAACLPRLKKLLLACVWYEADDSLPNLLSGCPVLQELDIQFTHGAHGLVFCCNVSSSTVTRLTVWTHPYAHGYAHAYRLLINTPALEYLNIEDIMPENVLSGALTSLIEARICFDNLIRKEDPSPHYSSASILGLVDRLTNVKFLNLFLPNRTKIVDSLLSTWTMTSFHNLTKLRLDADYRFLFKILENAHSLEILTFFNKVCKEINEWNEPKKVPTCLLSHVRTIRLVRTTRHDFETVRYLLRNALVLQRMEITYPIDTEEKKHMLQEISRFERGSSSCELAFLDP